MNRIFTAFVIAAAAMLSSGCSKKDDARCKAEARTVSDAGVIFANAQSTDNCLRYKAAIAEYLNSPCSEGLSSSDRLQLQNIMNNLPC